MAIFNCRVRTSLAVIVSSALFVSPSFAQTIDEVTVTAQKRSENLQDVPIAVTAFSVEAIEKAGFNDLSEIAYAVPSMSIASHFQYANPKIYLRGVGNNEYQANAVGSVAVYQDDVYLAATSGQLFQFFDLEAVEVLRGPQGTLYGKNTTGGAINVRSRRPGDAFEGNLSVSAGNFGSLDLDGGFSFPLIDGVLAARLAFVSNSRDGYIENSFVDAASISRNNEDVNDRNSNAARLLVVYTPNDELSVDFNIHLGENRSTAMQGESFFLFDTDADPMTPLQVIGFYRDLLPLLGVDPARLQGAENPDKFNQAYNYDISESLDASGGSIKFTYDFARFSLTSISAVESVERNSREDVDQTPASILHIEWDNESDQFTQELQLSNSGEGPLSWITGLYFFDDEIKVANTYDLGRDFPAVLGATGLVNQNYVQDTDAVGVYLQGSYAFSAETQLTMGVRYTDETREWEGASTLNVDVGGGTIIGIPTVPQQRLEEDWQSTSWRVALDHRLSENMLSYGSVTRGHKAGGFNGGAIASVDELGPFDQEVLTAYELGFKSDLADGRVRLNVAAFFYDYDDIQIFTIEPPQGGIPIPLQIIRNAESAENYGIEVELDALITDRLAVVFRGAYLNTEIGNYAPRPDIGLDFTGNNIGNSPEYDASLGVNYVLPVRNDSSWDFHLDVTAKAEHWFDPSNTDRVYQGGYQIWNGSISYVRGSSDWTVSLWSKNLFDKEYTTEIIPIDGFFFDEHFAGVPRTYGVKFAYNFR